MRKFFYLSLIALSLTNCTKEELLPQIENPDFIIAGDSLSYVIFSTDYTIDGLDNGDSIPDWYPSSSSGYENSPVSFDTHENEEFRYGYLNYLVNNYLILRSFFISNNYGNTDSIDFAINVQDINGRGAETLKTVKLFSFGDTININQLWLHNENPDYYNSYFISYYYDYESDNNLRFPFDSEPLQGSELYINGTVTDKYIGIRKRINNEYVYGYIKFSMKNYDQFKLLGYAFAD